MDNRVELDIKIGCNGGAITLFVKNGEHYPYLHGGYISSLGDGKEMGAYNQIRELIEELEALQGYISDKKEIHSTKAPLLDGDK